MPDASSTETLESGAMPSRRVLVFIMATSWIPLAQIASSVALGAWLASLAGVAWALAAAAVWLLVAPPLAVRLATRIFGRPHGSCDADSREFLGWWLCLQLQTLFNRLPAIEETLRLVPTLYSMWLRLFGARVGRLVSWTPGVVVSDRQFLDVGDQVVVGTGARITAHTIDRDARGRMRLTAATIRIEDRAMVGAYSVVSPGATISSEVVTKPCRPLRPFVVVERPALRAGSRVGSRIDQVVRKELG